MTSTRLVGRFWLVVWSAALSWSWLLPNHYLPWPTFHMETWAAVVMLTMAAFVLWATRQDRQVSWSVIVVLVLAAMPWLQFQFGLVRQVGTAWTTSAFLLGLALALLIGHRWEASSPGQAGDGVFLAVGTAAVLSVGLQLHQWLQLGWFDLWLMGDGFGRPFANFGQPNQLGSFLLWGCLALGWGYVRGQLRPWVAAVAATFLLFGVALTASRTAWIGLALITAGAWYWRRLWPHRSAPWVISGLALCFALWVVAIPHLASALMLTSADGFPDLQTRMSGDMRLRAWPLFVDAAMQRPWFGYGWNQLPSAHLQVATEHPALFVLFSHSHNLLLDLLLWCGIVLGLCVVGLLLVWCWRRAHAVDDAPAVVGALLLLMMGNHAMLELPLHHAYFLLPVGLLAGALEARQGAVVARRAPRWLGVTLWLVATLMLAAVVRDYLRIEAAYQLLRFEWSNIRTNEPREVPPVLVLDQLADLIWISRFEPSKNMSHADMNRMRNTVLLYPSVASIHKYAIALAWNGEPAAAATWLRKLCAVSPKPYCDAIRRSWTDQAKRDPLVAAVAW